MSTYYYIDSIDKRYSALIHGFVDNTEITDTAHKVHRGVYITSAPICIAYYTILASDQQAPGSDCVLSRYVDQLLEITIPSEIDLRKWRLLDPYEHSRRWLVPAKVLRHATVRLVAENEREKLCAKYWAKHLSTKSRQTKALPKKKTISIKILDRSPSFISGGLYEQAIRDQQLIGGPGNLSQSLVFRWSNADDT